MLLRTRWTFKSIICKSIIYNGKAIKPAISVGNHWLSQAPYGDTTGQKFPTNQVKGATGTVCTIESCKKKKRRRRRRRGSVLIVSCQISQAHMSHMKALSRRRCLNWWNRKVRIRQRAIGKLCLWWCAAQNWCWNGLTGSMSVHCKTVIQSDRVVFPSLCKGYAIASSPHDTLNEPPLPEPETLIMSVLKLVKPCIWSRLYPKVIHEQIWTGSQYFHPLFTIYRMAAAAF